MLPASLSDALDQCADSAFLTDRGGVIEYVNPAFERMAGFSRAEAIGQTPRLLQSGVHTERFYEALWHTVLAGRPFRATMTNRRKDGRLFDHEQTITPIRDRAGTITHFLSIGRDITLRKRAEALRLRHQLDVEAQRVAGLLNDEAGQYLALAHMTLAEISRGADARAGECAQEVRRYLDHIEQRLCGLARGVKPSVVAEVGLVGAITFLATGYTRRTGVPIAVDSSLDAACPAAVETLLYQAVQATLANMSPHASTRSGSIAFAREVGGRRFEDNTVCCAIRGIGAGFDFGALGVGENGAGGAPLIRERLEAVGGTLTVTSVSDQGSEVRIAVPVEV